MIQRTQLDEEKQLALDCWYITGATAGGKTVVSIELAKKLDAEIISLDSMSLYRGMNIGTAKPTAQQLSEVPHHLIDIADPNEEFSLSRYRELALKAIGDVKSRGKKVVVCGGTALYLKALLRGIFDGPPADWDFRNKIEKEADEVGLPKLYDRLQQVDPVAAHKLHPTDRRRIIRALEVYTQTGTPISHLQQEFETGLAADECRVVSLRHPRDVLHRRIEKRVEQMFANGFVDEVKGLLERWQSLSRTAAQAVGYQEVISFLNGEMELDTAKERAVIRTRRFARHQETWFRGLSECRMLDIDETTPTSELVDRIIELQQKK